MNRKANQRKQIFQYMKDHGSITPMEAFLALHCTKLATRISEMIREGMEIDKEMVTEIGEDGQAVRYMRYRLAV